MHSLDDLQGLPKTKLEAISYGFSLYFTGKKCRAGHLAPRLLDGHCILCRRTDGKSRRKKNAESERQRIRKWRDENRDISRAASKKWRAENPEKARTNTRIYMARWRKKNRHEYLKKHRATQSARRSRIGEWTAKDVDNLFILQRGKCGACCTKLVKYHVDHIMPIALGGSNHKSNIQLLCPMCNSKKYAKHPIDFMRSIGYLL